MSYPPCEGGGGISPRSSFSTGVVSVRRNDVPQLRPTLRFRTADLVNILDLVNLLECQDCGPYLQ